MQIVVMSRGNAERWRCDQKWAAISISDWRGAPHACAFARLSEENRIDLLQLDFYDTNADIDGCFRELHAVEILDFARRISPKVEVLLVHCNMGMSRSPAVAAAISRLAGTDDSYFFRRYTPNTKVYHGIIRAAEQLGIGDGQLFE